MVLYFRFPHVGRSFSSQIIGEGKFSFGRRVNLGWKSLLISEKGCRLFVGEDVYFGEQVLVGPSNGITIGKKTTIQDRCRILGDVEIGVGVILAHNVFISSGRHQFDFVAHLTIQEQDALFQKMPSKPLPVQIEDDCWIGANVIVLPGVRIGKGTVIGANSVVTGHIPPYSVAGGIPARILKQRLNFQPPTSLHIDHEKDWPYFYSGFDLQRKHLPELASKGVGLVAGGRYCISVNAVIGRQMVFHWSSESHGRMEHEGQLIQVNGASDTSMEVKAVAANNTVLFQVADGLLYLKGVSVV